MHTHFICNLNSSTQNTEKEQELDTQRYRVSSVVREHKQHKYKWMYRIFTTDGAVCPTSSHTYCVWWTVVEVNDFVTWCACHCPCVPSAFGTSKALVFIPNQLCPICLFSKAFQLRCRPIRLYTTRASQFISHRKKGGRKIPFTHQLIECIWVYTEQIERTT